MNSDKKIILVDMDGVLANFEATCLERWREHYTDLPFIPLEKRKCFDVRKDYSDLGDGYGEMMNELMHKPDFYDNFPVIDGASIVLDQMLSDGFEVFICTAPMGNSRCMTAKVDWVQRVFGKKWVERMILTRDKTLIRGDILIDDKPKITGLVEPTFIHVLFDQPYNREEESKPRITQWSDWKGVITSVLNQ